MFIEDKWFIIWHVWVIAKSLFLRLISKLHIIDCERKRDKGCEIKWYFEAKKGVFWVF